MPASRRAWRRRRCMPATGRPCSDASHRPECLARGLFGDAGGRRDRAGRRRFPSRRALDFAYRARGIFLHCRRPRDGGRQCLRACLPGRQRCHCRRRRGDPRRRGGRGQCGVRAGRDGLSRQTHSGRLCLCRQPGQTGAAAGTGRDRGPARKDPARARQRAARDRQTKQPTSGSRSMRLFSSRAR